VIRLDRVGRVELVVALRGLDEAPGVAECLDGLTELQRQCIELSYYQGLTYVQVSQRLSANLATVKSRMRDALRGLRNCLGMR